MASKDNGDLLKRMIPFHCVICFDEFNFGERAPVVLPCGHTYVCAQCSARLTKCMECREPLFWRPNANAEPIQHQQQQQQQVPHQARYINRRAAAAAAAVPPKRRPDPIPYPIPRNHVLISLMEASRIVNNKNNSDDDEEEESSDHHDSVIDLSLLLESRCGTYAVKEELAVLPNDPRTRNTTTITSTTTTDSREPYMVRPGQLLQIVNFEHQDGVYQLARNQGFVVASDTHLVKGESFFFHLFVFVLLTKAIIVIRIY